MPGHEHLRHARLQHMHQGQSHRHPGGPSTRVHPNLPGYGEMYDRYRVNRDEWEVIKQTLYDSIAYPAAGLNVGTFFSVPIGQGTGFGGGTKNLSDTNMYLASNIPAQQAFLVQSVEIIFQPTTPTVAAQMPAVFGTQAAALIANDVYIFRRSGNLEFQIGSKDYLNEAPLSKFPSKTNFYVEGALADTTTAAAASQSRLAFANVRGPVYKLSPADLCLEANQNFSVKLNWPEGLQAITNPARIFVVLDGLLYRKSQ